MQSYGFYDTIQMLMLWMISEVTRFMRKDIQPKYEATTVRCACGELIETKSTRQNFSVEICSKCHPFFTGKQKLVDSGGRVDRFKKRFNLSEGTEK